MQIIHSVCAALFKAVFHTYMLRFVTVAFSARVRFSRGVNYSEKAYEDFWD